MLTRKKNAASQTLKWFHGKEAVFQSIFIALPFLHLAQGRKNVALMMPWGLWWVESGPPNMSTSESPEPTFIGSLAGGISQMWLHERSHNGEVILEHSVTTRVLKSGRRRQSQCQRGTGNGRQAHRNRTLLASKLEEGPAAKEYKWPSGTRQGQGPSSRAPALCWDLDFRCWDLSWLPDLQNY